MKKEDPKNVCWQLFEKTGKISYYMLYKKFRDND